MGEIILKYIIGIIVALAIAFSKLIYQSYKGSYISLGKVAGYALLSLFSWYYVIGVVLFHAIMGVIELSEHPIWKREVKIFKK